MGGNGYSAQVVGRIGLVAPRQEGGAMTAPAGARWNSAYHAPVLVDEVAELYRPCAQVLDGTLGGGGHTAALLDLGITVTGLDRDPASIAAARARLASEEGAGRFRALLGNFAEIEEMPELAGVMFDGILLDLGVSSHQIETLARGFSFREGTPLDMRMSGSDGTDAASLLATADERELTRVFREYADEPRAPRLAKEIVRRRRTRPLVTSDDLVGAIRGAFGPRTGPPDFARLFQAVRIAVNDELTALERALPVLRDRLRPGGVLGIIAYHSGEDRLVKQAFREWSAACVCPPRLPRCECRGHPLGRLVVHKPITTSVAEAAANPRARSARLRVWRRAA
jgi:16S rRNA (cytosine1402-N4)-methyltransferase